MLYLCRRALYTECRWVAYDLPAMHRAAIIANKSVDFIMAVTMYVCVLLIMNGKNKIK